MRMINLLPRKLRGLVKDQSGVAMIETALVAPVLAMFALGTFDISGMIARQHELQVGATDAEGIVLAVSDGTATNISTIKSVLVSSLSLPTDKVIVTKMYRCGSNANLVASSTTCSGDTATYVKVELSDTYTPTWTKFGVGKPMNYSVTRTVQVS